MKKKQEQKNVYDSVFDFIFSVQKSGENKPFRKPQPSDGVYASSLMEIGTQPAIYPLESAFNTINGYIEGETAVNLGDGVSVSLGSILRGEGNKEIKKKISKNRAEANFARVGGNLHSGIDGALVSLYSKFNGASGKTAYETGKLFADLRRSEMQNNSQKNIFGYRTPEEIAEEDEIFRQRGTDLMIAELAKKYPGINKGMLSSAVSLGLKQGNYVLRVADLRQKLRMSGVTKVKDLDELTKYVWGDGKKDLGLFLRERGKQEGLGDKVERLLSDMEMKGEKERRDEIYRSLMKDKKTSPDIAMEKARELAKSEFLEKEVIMDIKRAVEAIQNPKERDKAVFTALKKGYKFDTATRGAIMRAVRKELETESTANTAKDIANKAVLTSLAMDIEMDGRKKGDYDKVTNARDRANKILGIYTSRESLGSRVQRQMLLARWIANSGKGDILREGNWERFGVDDLNYTKIMERQLVKDENGDTIGFYYVPAKSVMGKLIGSAYYLHPNNLIKGLFLDGSLWLKWASRGGKLNKRSFAYLAYQARIGKMFSMMAKPFNFITTAFVKLLNPFAESIKKFAKNVLKRMIGASGIAGWVVNKLMDILGDKLQEAIAQVAQAVVLAVVAMLFLLLSGGMSNTEKKVESIIPPPNTEEMVASVSDNAFTEEDFSPPELESLEKEKDF